jgi:endonuclease/exonuclease/phosphatase family metal-dependent hydrolase
LLHCEIDLDGQRVHCLCTHFGLFAKGKRTQTGMLVEYVQNRIPSGMPLIIAGDFNDWRNLTNRTMADELGMHDVFHLHSGRSARSYPASLPLLRLDRIYVRGFNVLHSDVHAGGVWQRLSDHAALSAQLKRQGVTGAP